MLDFFFSLVLQPGICVCLGDLALFSGWFCRTAQDAETFAIDVHPISEFVWGHVGSVHVQKGASLSSIFGFAGAGSVVLCGVFTADVPPLFKIFALPMIGPRSPFARRSLEMLWVM